MQQKTLSPTRPPEFKLIPGRKVFKQQELYMFLSPVSAPSYRRASTASFDRFIDGVLKTKNTPSVEQDERSYKLQIDVPGVPRDQLNISIEGQVVRIKTSEQAKRHYSGGYELPEEIDASSSTAKLEDGVLYLTLTKKVPVSRATTLPIL